MENTTIPYFPDFSRREKFIVSLTALVVIEKRYDVMEVQDRAVAFPHGTVDGVAALSAFNDEMRGIF